MEGKVQKNPNKVKPEAPDWIGELEGHINGRWQDIVMWGWDRPKGIEWQVRSVNGEITVTGLRNQITNLGR